MLCWILGGLALAALVGLIYFVVFVRNVMKYGDMLLDEKPEESGGKLVASVLHSMGVEFMFVLCGGHISPIYVEAEKLGIKVVDVRDEATAVFAADAVSRLTGRTGIALVTAGPGVTNAMTAMKNAQMANSPVILFGGAAATLLKGRGALQDVDQINMMKPVCKKVYSVTTVADIVPAVRDAFRVTQSVVPGPVFVEIPIDLLYPFPAVAKELGGGGGDPNRKKPLMKRLMQFFIKYKLYRNFYNGFESTPSNPNTPLPQVFPKNGLNTIRSSLSSLLPIISSSSRPLFLLGSQMVRRHDLTGSVIEALSSLEIPFFVSGKARGITGITNEFFFRHSRKQFVREADVIVLLGISCDFRLGYGRSLNKRAKIISVNIDENLVTMNAPIMWKCFKSLVACPQRFLVEFAKHYVASASRSEERSHWLEELRSAQVTREEFIQEMAEQEVGEAVVNPLELCQVIEQNYVDEDSIIIVDGGDFAATTSYIVKPRGAYQWLDPGPFGTLGVGAGFILGAKCVHPEKKVFVFYGDGSLGWSLIEFDTFRRMNLKQVYCIVGNDRCWGQVYRDQKERYGVDTACRLIGSNYHLAASALGSDGFVLTEKEEMEEIVGEAMRAGDDRPVLLNAMIGSTDFRKGSISV